MTKSTLVLQEEGDKVKIAINIMSGTIESELEKVYELEACELWVIHHESINTNFENIGKSRHKLVLVHPVLLNCAIAFLAKTSLEIYNEISKVMLLSNVRYVYWKIAKLISPVSSLAYYLHRTTIKTSIVGCFKLVY